jgi:4-hydroxybenzoate polyprenyltransferase
MPLLLIIAVLVFVALLATSPGLAALALLFISAGAWAGWVIGWNAAIDAVRDEDVGRAEENRQRRLRGWYRANDTRKE